VAYVGKKLERHETWTMDIGSLGAADSAYVELNTIYIDAENDGDSISWTAIIDAS